MKLFDEKLLDEGFIEYLLKFSEGIKLPPALVVQNIILAKLARDKAEIDVLGSSEKLLYEFPGRTGEDGETYLITGAELYDMVYQMEKEQLERERLEQIQSTGIPFDMLPPEDQEILKRFNQDPESLEKRKQENELYEEYKADLEAQGLKPFYTEKDLEE